MANFEDDTDKADADRPAYDEELLSANWNPVIDLLAWSCQTRDRVSAALTTEMTDSEVAAFLGRIYAAGT